MQFAQELLCECVKEVMPLLQMHHAEVMPHGEAIPLDPDWDCYALLERLGRFVVFTARDDGRLVGYAAFHLMPHLQSRQFLRAVNEVIFVAPEHRRGMLALSFVKHCHDRLTAAGARHIAYESPLTSNLAPILHRIGYEDEARVVGRMT